jgi:ABC-type amino acid transport substrate-binding protein
MVIGLAQVAQVEQLLFKKNNKNLKELSINGLNSTLKKLFENWRPPLSSTKGFFLAEYTD